MPLVPFHLTLVQNIKRDPFEQAVGIDQKTAMGLGGALGGPVTAYLYDWNMLPIGQQLWLKELVSYEKYPAAAGPGDLQPESGSWSRSKRRTPCEPIGDCDVTTRSDVLQPSAGASSGRLDDFVRTCVGLLRSRQCRNRCAPLS